MLFRGVEIPKTELALSVRMNEVENGVEDLIWKTDEGRTGNIFKHRCFQQYLQRPDGERGCLEPTGRKNAIRDEPGR